MYGRGVEVGEWRGGRNWQEEVGKVLEEEGEGEWWMRIVEEERREKEEERGEKDENRGRESERE